MRELIHTATFVPAILDAADSFLQGDISLSVTTGWSKLFFSKINKVLNQQSFVSFCRQNAYNILLIKHKRQTFDGYSKHIKVWV